MVITGLFRRLLGNSGTFHLHIIDKGDPPAGFTPRLGTIHRSKRTRMLTHLLPSVAEWTLPERIEIELRIEIER